MNILKLAFKYAPKEAGKLMKKINSDDKKISNLVNKLTKQIYKCRKKNLKIYKYNKNDQNKIQSNKN